MSLNVTLPEPLLPFAMVSSVLTMACCHQRGPLASFAEARAGGLQGHLSQRIHPRTSIREAWPGSGSPDSSVWKGLSVPHPCQARTWARTVRLLIVRPRPRRPTMVSSALRTEFGGGLDSWRRSSEVAAAAAQPPRAASVRRERIATMALRCMPEVECFRIS